MTDLQVEILKILEKNSRIDLSEIASKLDISENIVQKTLVELEESNVICGYHALINWDNTSNEVVTALIEVKVNPQKEAGFDKIAERLCHFTEVSSVSLMSGGYDFMVIIEGKSMKEVARFVFEKLSTIDAVNSTATHFVLKKYKEHGTTMLVKKTDTREQGMI